MNILITGGASGLGKALAAALAKERENQVYITYHQSKPEISSSYAIQCDFSNAGSISALIDTMQSMELDILINNAWPGDFLQTQFHKQHADDIRASFDTTVIPWLRITKAALLKFQQQKKGMVVSILSAGLFHKPAAGASVYLAEKAYLQQMMKSWAAENEKFNIRFRSVSPSFMETGMTELIDERWVDQIRKTYPGERLLTPEDAAKTISGIIMGSSVTAYQKYEILPGGKLV
jgi:NAD(P)-dependent dehydrogenase (short-subunit alcohol dehydrogenase family)